MRVAKHCSMKWIPYRKQHFWQTMQYHCCLLSNCDTSRSTENRDNLSLGQNLSPWRNKGDHVHFILLKKNAFATLFPVKFCRMQRIQLGFGRMIPDHLYHNVGVSEILPIKRLLPTSALYSLIIGLTPALKKYSGESVIIVLYTTEECKIWPTLWTKISEI